MAQIKSPASEDLIVTLRVKKNIVDLIDKERSKFSASKIRLWNRLKNGVKDSTAPNTKESLDSVIRIW